MPDDEPAMLCADCRDALSAYVDGEMMPEEARGVGDHLATCPSCSSTYESLAATSRLLREGLVRYSAPDVLKARIHGALMQAEAGPQLPSQPNPTEARAPGPRASWRASRRWGWLAAGGVVVALASSLVTYSVVERQAAAHSASADVLASHVRSLMPGHLMDVVSTNQHNVKPWFNGRVNLSPDVPALDSAGFVLAGGRLDYLGGHTVAVVVYLRRQHVINVYSWPERGRDLSPSATAEQGYHMIHWRSQDVAYWVVSDLNSGELGHFVTLLQGSASAGR